MNLKTNKEYLFMLPNGQLAIHSSRVKTKRLANDSTRVWINIENFLDRGAGPQKISVSSFNKLHMTFVRQL